jgi:hypothetical protein
MLSVIMLSVIRLNVVAPIASGVYRLSAVFNFQLEVNFRAQMPPVLSTTR